MKSIIFGGVGSLTCSYLLLHFAWTCSYDILLIPYPFCFCCSCIVFCYKLENCMWHYCLIFVLPWQSVGETFQLISVVPNTLASWSPIHLFLSRFVKSRLLGLSFFVNMVLYHMLNLALRLFSVYGLCLLGRNVQECGTSHFKRFIHACTFHIYFHVSF